MMTNQVLNVIQALEFELLRTCHDLIEVPSKEESYMIQTQRIERIEEKIDDIFNQLTITCEPLWTETKDLVTYRWNVYCKATRTELLDGLMAAQEEAERRAQQEESKKSKRRFGCLYGRGKQPQRQKSLHF
jgi:hypothetical protein